MFKLYLIISIALFTTSSFSKGTNIIGLGLYDVKFDGSDQEQAADFRYEFRSDKTLFDIGPEEDNFFFLKPFFGFEYTSDSASYLLTGIYVEDNVGELFEGKNNDFYFTPSLGFGYYDDGSGKKLGYDIQFRTSLEVSYELKTKSRLAISFSHISNANIGDKNPGVETISILYHIPY